MKYLSLMGFVGLFLGMIITIIWYETGIIKLTQPKNHYEIFINQADSTMNFVENGILRQTHKGSFVINGTVSYFNLNNEIEINSTNDSNLKFDANAFKFVEIIPSNGMLLNDKGLFIGDSLNSWLVRYYKKHPSGIIIMTINGEKFMELKLK